MNAELKNRMRNGCPLLKDAIEYFESMEAKTVQVGADDVNVEKTVSFDGSRRLVSVLFVNSDGADEGIDTYDIDTNGFKFKAGSQGVLFYRTEEVVA